MGETKQVSEERYDVRKNFELLTVGGKPQSLKLCRTERGQWKRKISSGSATKCPFFDMRVVNMREQDLVRLVSVHPRN